MPLHMPFASTSIARPNPLRGPLAALTTVLALIAGPALAQAAPLVKGPTDALQVTEADMQADALRVPVESRPALLSKPGNIKAVASNLYTRRALAAEAEKAGLGNDPKIQAALRIARERVLSDARIAQIDAANEPKDAKALDQYARQVYDGNQARFQAPEQAKVRHILLKKDAPDAKAQADKLLAQLKAGGDFAAKAKELSQDPGSAQQGGELPVFGRGQMVPPFETAVFALKKKGDFAPVVETQFGYHIIQLEEKRAAGVRSFDEVKPVLRNEVRTRILQEARAKESDRLLNEAQIDEAAIEAFSAKFR